MWVADIVEQRGLLAFFDRSDLKEITEAALEEKVLSSKCLVTIIDPATFNSMVLCMHMPRATALLHHRTTVPCVRTIHHTVTDTALRTIAVR